MSELRTPSYDLNDIKKAFIDENMLRMTVTAKKGQMLLGFSDKDVVDAIQNLATVDFYKSMSPVKEGFSAWQDVYKSRFKGIDLYIKFQINSSGELILSFKEK